ncbi:DUF4127 family protein [Agromyces aurantiacus]|uniref:DUF4127 family protein n=1 Tax=Agromyces aurantiacus TaxID=165814 RepID=A0ABV9R615_9MICO|nr:DUF4127 family protein [Agromyces aurantiacus]MBM7503606.1 hypothetical protein [Agromyces aurantiacus]
MRIVLVPLDERPVSARLPGLVAAIAGAAVDGPPAEALPSVRRPGDVDLLSSWFAEAAANADGAVVSLDALGFGGLIPSRIGDEPLEQVLTRWSVLRGLDVPVHAAVVVPRSPDALDAFEEPEYWAQWGPSLHALSARLADGDRAGRADRAEGAEPVPGEVRADWLRRRLRQHALGLAAVGLAADGTISRLFVGVDDAATRSLSAVAQAELDAWTARLELRDRVVVGPGADETGAVLTARLLVDRLAGDTRPRVALACAEPDGLRRVAPYETGPVGTTARAQVEAAGGVLVDEPAAADAVLVVHAPDGSRGDWAVAAPATTDDVAACRTAELVARLLDGGAAVAVGDVAQPNGADPKLVRELAATGAVARLDGYAAWNTAGNTLGTAAAHLVTAVVARRAGVFDEAAASRLVRLRLIEDFGYMSVARAALRRELGSPVDRHDRIDDPDAASAFVAGRLGDALVSIPGLGIGPVRPEHVRFPWGRSFEIALADDSGGLP